MKEKDLKCKCGEVLEKGIFNILWCPECGNDWEIPLKTQDDPRYYFRPVTQTQE
jgi:hypothetical protein